MDQFVKQVLEEEKFSQEQKSYLLDCLEQGEEMEEVLYLAKSCLSVEQMERIKQLLSPASTNVFGQSEKAMESKEKGEGGIGDEDTGTALPARTESGNSLGVWNHYSGSAADISDTDFDMRKGAGIKEALSVSQKKAGRTMGGLGNRGGSLRNQITEAVREAIRMEITKDLYLPKIEVLHLQVFPQGKKTPLVGEATIRVLGITVKGILLKRGKYGGVLPYAAILQ